MLLAHEDKVFQGAIVASMRIPWGETKGDQYCDILSGLDARSCAQRDRAARHWTNEHATARVDLAESSHSATRRQFSTKQLDRWDRLLVGTAA